MTRKQFPSEEDLARARAAMQDRDRGLSEVCSQIVGRFQSSGLHEVFLLYSPANDVFVAHIFYCRTNQIQESEASGLASQIRREIVEELVRIGRGSRETIKVQFELDSHENVEANFGGNYFLRLR